MLMNLEKVHQSARADQAGAGVGAKPVPWGGSNPHGGYDTHGLTSRKMPRKDLYGLSMSSLNLASA